MINFEVCWDSNETVAALPILDLDAWRAGFDDLVAQFAGRFVQVQTRKRARAYVLGLLSRTERKNGWTLAEQAGDHTPDGMQRLLNHAVRDADKVRDNLRGYVVDHLGHEQAVLVAVCTHLLTAAPGSPTPVATSSAACVARIP